MNDIFQSFRDDSSPTVPGRAPTATAVYRQGLALWRMGLEPRAALLLNDLVSGVPLAVAVATLEARSQAAAQTPQGTGLEVVLKSLPGLDSDGEPCS